MKRRANKFLVLILVAAMVLTLMPMNALAYNDMCIRGTITWHGGDPSAVAFLVNTRGDAYGTYENTAVIYKNTYYNGSSIQGYPQLYLSPSTYIGNGEWTLTYEVFTSQNYVHTILPFVGISESTLEGKWYCDKWAWNNVIYQPGQYAPKSGSYLDTNIDRWIDTFSADFFLTNSESATKTVTFNRSFYSGMPAVDSTLSLYRYYSISDQYELINTMDLPAAASSVTFNNLYSGQYAIKQTLPTHYSDNASAACDGITGLCFQADLTSAASASLSATTSKKLQKQSRSAH